MYIIRIVILKLRSTSGIPVGIVLVNIPIHVSLIVRQLYNEETDYFRFPGYLFLSLQYRDQYSETR